MGKVGPASKFLYKWKDHHRGRGSARTSTSISRHTLYGHESYKTWLVLPPTSPGLVYLSNIGDTIHQSRCIWTQLQVHEWQCALQIYQYGVVEVGLLQRVMLV